MSKRNVRYLRQDQSKGAKVAEKPSIGKKNDGSLLSGPAIIDGFQGVQGRELTVKSREPMRNMPKKRQRNEKSKLGALALQRGTRREKLANIKTRVIALKYGNIWQKKTFGSVTPNRARKHYEKQVLKKSLRQWEDIWWNGKNEWKLNIRADYHNRFRLWLKVWRAWRSFITLRQIKKTKLNLAQTKANHVHLAKFFVCWKTYVAKRRKKKEFYLWAQDESKTLSMKQVFARWKNCLMFKRKLLSMEEEALHFWARSLFHKAWETWVFIYNLALDEKHKYAFAVQVYNRKLAFKAFSSFKLYGIQRKLKKLRFRSGERYHRLQSLRCWFLMWKVTLRRRKELARFDDAITQKGEETRKRRMFVAWKCYIIMCHRKQESQQKASNHVDVSLKTKCLKVLQKRVTNRKKNDFGKVTAIRFSNTLLVRKTWNLWLKKCENTEELRLMTVNKLVRNHHKKYLMKNVLAAWRLYCERRRLRGVERQKADEMARRYLIPRCFGRWEAFVEITKERRTTFKKAEDFRRECLLAKTYYHWWRSYQQTLDVRMLHRMAIITYDEKLSRQFFTIWLTKARWKMKENTLTVRGQRHYERQLKKKYLLTWSGFIKHINHYASELEMAVRHQNTKLLVTSWAQWTKFVHKRREKWKVVVIADLCFHRRILKKTLYGWKIHSDRMKEIKSHAEERKLEYEKITTRILFQRWRRHARCLKEFKEGDHKAFRYWKLNTERQGFGAWRTYAVNNRWKRENALSKIAVAQKELKRGKLRRYFFAWRRRYSLQIRTNNLTTRAIDYWNRRILKKSIDAWMKYRFLGYRKMVLRQQCMWYHNQRITASFLEIWKANYKLRVDLKRKCHIALWMWSFTLQRKTFSAWFQYAKDKKRRKRSVNEALERRRHWLHTVGVTQWIKFATSAISEREKFVASRQVRLSQDVQRIVQRCAVHWMRKTQRNRGKSSCNISRPNVSSTTNENVVIRSAFVKDENEKDRSRTIENIELAIHQGTKRPKPRRPAYLRESFNLSEICDDEPAVSVKPAHDSEAFPRQWGSDMKPAEPPVRVREPNDRAIAEGLAWSDDSRGGPERRILKSRGNLMSGNTRSRGNHVLLPPSCFVSRMDQMANGDRKGMKEGATQDGTTDRNYKEPCDLGPPAADEETHVVDHAHHNDSLDAGDVPRFLREKESQQSIVQLRDRMDKYYTVSMQLRNLRRKLKSLRQWSSQPSEKGEKIGEEELILVHELIKKLSNDVDMTSRNLDDSYETISNDLKQLLGKIT